MSVLVQPEEYPDRDYMLYWITKREKARVDPNGCGDPNIDNWRYCNVRREDDRVTKNIKGWLSPHVGHKMFIPNVLMARLFNNPNTLKRVGFMAEWDPQWVMQITDLLTKHGHKVFNPAYIVSTNGRKMEKVQYLCSEVLPAAFDNPINLNGNSLEDIHERLVRLNGVGSFIGAQVVADLKMFEPWASAPDYWTFVAPGPGSMRGMNRVRGLPANVQKYNQKAFSMYIQPLRSIISTGTGIELCAQNAQNVCCEFDKYMRLLSGEGRPKQTYRR